MRCLAIDIGGTKIATALVENNQISQRHQITSPQENTGIAMCNTLACLVQQYQGQFDYIAVASTGIINQGRLTALNPKNLGGLAEFPLYKGLASVSDKPIFLLNDVQAAAFAEYQQEDPNTVQNFVFITVSTGVGGGIVQNGHLLTEPNGVAGHIGHTLADPNEVMCGCGRRGCVEAVASGRAIEAISSQWENPCSPKQVFELFRKNDEKATALVERSAKAIANLIANLRISLDTQKVVIGGSVGLADGYLSLVKKFMQNQPHFYHCSVRPAKFGNDAGLIGAAAWGNAQLLQKQSQDTGY
ncbi:N-acetylmannosamine kinase [Actinobacillus seminis]|uniref:N-acetylmannosamine kinase n=1 Tax=Actinobacillus seminis TaxID=722 RepID=A0A263HES6_9PAST|nr:N-acetylmannosamine kinase [Actinobacillus seminis]OZN25915.1 N-acetylmannosamine kinase [Actinobacillus seminis]SUU34541.1 N-acetylmannosamine kinase [Actinobacillus seminis]